MNDTLEYYNDNASEFVAGTQNVDMTVNQDKFLTYLKDESKILDFGCGSGRDSKYFLDKGFLVEAIDGSEELCRYASLYAGINVKQLLFTELDSLEEYNGIWACASILHLPINDLDDVFIRICKALKKGGVFYTSFKYGEFSGFRNGRFFTDMTEKSFLEFSKKYNELQIVEYWISNDARPDRGNEKWLNVIMQKK